MLNGAAERLTGWVESKALGQGLDAVLPVQQAESEPGLLELAGLALVAEEAVTFEKTLAQGRQVEGSVAPVRISAGAAGVVIVLRDVSRRRWEERQLRQAQRMETAARLAAGVANDYGNLMGIVRAHTAQLLAQFGEYSPARKALEEIERAASAADQITRRLTQFGTRQSLHSERLSLNGIVRRMARLIESVAGPAITVTVQPRSGRGSGQVLADEAQLEQAIMSLVLHACAVTPAGGSLTVETGGRAAPGGPDQHVVLTITYSAAEPDLERLFDPLETGETALALAVAQSLITEQGGYIAAHPVEQGTQIEVLLPLAPAALGEPMEIKTAVLPTVLLIDQRERVRLHLHNVMEEAGYNLLEAGDAAEAIALCEVRDQAIDLLIATGAEADEILAGVAVQARPRQMLRLGEDLRAPFTQSELLGKVQERLEGERVSAASGG
jgi:PAS domain S-box-containing protein